MGELMKTIAWLCCIVGGLILIQYVAYFYLLRSYNTWVKVGLTLLYVGIFLLTIRVFRQQYLASKNDPFKEIKR
tara:strand:+ start:221 stop:442 length:222 start_codon:yes stop_codon:yes gene_type:complete